MKGAYTAQIAISSVTAAKTLLYITAASSRVVEIISAFITPSGSNTTNQNCRAAWQRIGTLGTPTGTSITPTPTEYNDQAASSTVVGNVTASEPTYTSGVIHGHMGFSSLGGYQFTPVPEERPCIPPSGSWGLRLLDSIASADLVVDVTFVERG